jgi:predicted nucleotidyltransferase component of viral defense system
MKYASGRTFRQALEDRLRYQQRESGLPLARLRKTVAFERLLVRLDNRWVLKGGLALQLRTLRPRTTLDIDLNILDDRADSPDESTRILQESARLKLDDYFGFQVRLGDRSPGHPGYRYHVTSLLAGREFERFPIDVGMGDPIVEPIEMLRLPFLLEFAGLEPTHFPCYPLSQHLAEKIHAFTRQRSGDPSRVKDLVDMLLIAEIGVGLRVDILRDAMQATFDARQTHAVPSSLGPMPAGWHRPYQEMARLLDLPFRTLGEAEQAAQQFIVPVLAGLTGAIWHPLTWLWQER